MRGARPERALEGAVAATVDARPDEVLVAAVSGGSDSVALAALLERAAAAAGARLVLAHVNHATRPSAWQDEAVVLALGAELGARVACRTLAPGSATEARLRELRYVTLAEIARDAGAQRVFTAHHAEDQTETVLLALFRGTGPDGLAGIAARRALDGGVTVERPVLGTRKAELCAYALGRRLPIAVDPTNVDGAYRRNALRGPLVELRAAFPHLDEAVARCAAIVADERAGKPRAAVRRELRAALAERLGDLRDIPFERLDAAAAALVAGRPGRHYLRGGVEIVVDSP